MFRELSFIKNPRYVKIFVAAMEVTDPDKCWEWQKFLQEIGYSRLISRDVKFQAPRLSWVLANKQFIPGGYDIYHSCDNVACINPSHLFLDITSNSHHTPSRISNLSPWDVVAIRLLSCDYDPKEVMEILGLSLPDYGKKIINGKRWLDHNWDPNSKSYVFSRI